jgi:hypothetical protein
MNYNLLIIDNSIHDYLTIIGAVQTNTRYILLDSHTDTYDTLKTKISELNLVSFQNVGIIQHNMGGASYSLFRNADASTTSTLANVIQTDPNLDTWADYVNFINYLKNQYQMENFDLMACALYSDANWKYVIDTLETRTGVNFRASKDNTGSSELGGNWFLETDSINLKDVYFTDAIDGFRGVLNALYSFEYHTFTNAGKIGPYGPTLSQVRSAYSFASWAQDTTNNYLNMTTQGIQLWKVPMTGVYSFVVVGGHGAMGTSATTGSRGGRGGYLTGSITLTQGHIIKIVVGQAGSYTIYNGGGGGASFIYNETTSVLLAVAGGGGGTRQDADYNGHDASTENFGTTSSSSSANDGFAYNNTATLFNGKYASLGYGGVEGYYNWGDGGAGWFGNGNDDTVSGTVAKALSAEATGGIEAGGADGGFGGGGSGAGQNGGGGGGGYTGGNGGYIAGGGGSYINTSYISNGAINIDTGRSYVLNGSPVHGYVFFQALSVAPTLSWSAITRNFGDSAFTITPPTSNSSGSFSYTSSNTSVASISGSTVTIVGAGTTTITATQAASGNYTSGSITTTLTVNPIAPSLSNFTVASRNFGTGSFTLTAPTSNSNGSFTYNSDTTAVATISGTTVTIVGAGNSLITATQAATTNYLQGSINAVFTVNPIAPTFNTFSAISKNFGDSPFTISASSNSSGAITYTSSNPSVATISGTTVTIVAAGSTLITANQAASGNYTSGSTSTTLTVIPLHLYTFTGHTFTNAGAIGRNGPTLSTVRTAYSGVSWAQDTTNNYLNMTTQGIQLWTVPQTGSYTFRAIGAGSEYANVNGGQGVDISTTVNLTKGEVIRILVGQKGSANNSGGGGGATYAVKNDGTTIIVAGGGGGAFNGSTFINSIPQSNATTNNSGNNSFFNQ